MSDEKNKKKKKERSTRGDRERNLEIWKPVRPISNELIPVTHPRATWCSPTKPSDRSSHFDVFRFLELPSITDHPELELELVGVVSFRIPNLLLPNLLPVWKLVH